MQVKLYEMEASPPCVMVRSFLAYAGIAHQSILVSIPGKKEIKWSKYKKVPIVTVNGLQVSSIHKSVSLTT